MTADRDAAQNVQHPLLLPQPPFQQETEKIRYGVEFSVPADVSGAEFDAVPDVRIMARIFQKPVQGAGTAVGGFHFHGDQGICIPDEKVHFQGALGVFVVIQAVALLDQHLGGHVFKESAFVNTKVPVPAQIQLGFFVQRGDKETGVGKIQLVLVWVVISFQRQFWMVQAIADIDDAGVGQPVHYPQIFPAPGSVGHFGKADLQSKCNKDFPLKRKMTHGLLL